MDCGISSPVLRFGTAGTGIDLDKAVAVSFARKQAFDLFFGGGGFNFGQTGLGFGNDIGIIFLFAEGNEFDRIFEHVFDIADTADQPVKAVFSRMTFCARS